MRDHLYRLSEIVAWIDPSKAHMECNSRKAGRSKWSPGFTVTLEFTENPVINGLLAVRTVYDCLQFIAWLRYKNWNCDPTDSQAGIVPSLPRRALADRQALPFILYLTLLTSHQHPHSSSVVPLCSYPRPHPSHMRWGTSLRLQSLLAASDNCFRDLTVV
ncbi:hypothetical protein FRB91_005195 [Serendipita sp. 411]|nr:hypothetical protein FRB91_005195 [Serendipita sp. 411]